MSRELKFRAWDGEKMTQMSTLFLDIKYRKEIIIMQYTGLKDKNGIEIYEGDIVLLPDTESEFVDTGDSSCGAIMTKVAEYNVGTISTVVFKDGGFCFKIESSGEFWQRGLTSFHNTHWTNNYKDIDNSELEKEIEIIGNIYQNPELLSK